MDEPCFWRDQELSYRIEKGLRMKKWSEVVRNAIKIPTLIAGSFAVSTNGSIASTTGEITKLNWDETGLSKNPILPNTLNSTSEDKFARHRSHSSHSSHGSHRSSAGGRGVYVPPVSPPTNPPVVRPDPPKLPPKPTPADISMMTVKVQAALMRLGFFNGDITGVLGEETRSALKAYQRENGLKVTGRMDLRTLTRLGIPIP